MVRKVLVKEGKDFFTVDKINDCKEYLNALHDSRNGTGTEPEILKRVTALLRTYT